MFQLNVAHVPSLGYTLLWLRVAAIRRHEYAGGRKRPHFVFRVREVDGFPLGLYANSSVCFSTWYASVELANAAIAPGHMIETPVTDTKYSHCAHGHSHQGALRKTATQVAVPLEQALRSSEECDVAWGLHTRTKPSTNTRDL